MVNPDPKQGAPTEDEKRAKEAEEAHKAEVAAAKKAEADAKKQKEADEKAAKDAATGKEKFYKSSQAAGLTVLKEDGSSVRFTPRFDEFKGDRVKVGFLVTDDKEVQERLDSDPTVVEIKESEYKEAEDLDLAPVYSV